MTADKTPPGTAKKGFVSLVDSRKVSGSSRRAELSRSIRKCRQTLIELLDIPEEVSSLRNWTEVQREIHRKLEGVRDSHAGQRATECIESLLDAEEELIEGNLRLVMMVVKRFSTGYMGAMEEMDFIQEGCEGLIDAVRRFDFARDRGFLTYAIIRIRKRVLMAMERQQRLVRLPAHAVKKTIYLREVIDSFAAAHGRYPLPAEIEEETGGSVDWPILLSLSESVLPLHEPAGETGIPLSERLPGNGPSPEETDLRKVLEEAISRLDKRAKFVLVMRYGLLDGEVRTLSDIAGVLGLSIERTRQIEKSAIGLLHDSFCGYRLTDWLRGG